MTSCRSVLLDQAAALLGVSRRTIYNRIREGRLRTVRTRGGSQRVLLDSIIDLRRNPRPRRVPGQVDRRPAGCASPVDLGV